MGSEGHHHDIASAILLDRAQKDAWFRASPESPIPLLTRDAFAGLAYYPVDLALRFAGLVRAPYAGSGTESFTIPTSDGRMRSAWRVGSFSFRVADHDLSLTAYDLGAGSLFVPFKDLTSGRETYGAGRYLDVEPEPDGTYILDFNLAYHPFCAYSPDYSCPLTPDENRLSVRIAAGERLPADGRDA